MKLSKYNNIRKWIQKVAFLIILNLERSKTFSFEQITATA